MSNLYFHTRHIPEEHLDFSEEMGVRVKENGLCDCLEEEYAKKLRDIGVEFVETRFVRCCLETAPGEYDWTRVDRDIEKIEKAGLKPALFVWPQYKPQWLDLVMAKCLEHGFCCNIPSLWDERLLEYYDKSYELVKERYGDRIKFLYFGLYSDYGEIMYPGGTRHYKFSSEHGHHGFWCGDYLARENFKKCMEEKYGSVEALNKAWGTSYDSFDKDKIMVPVKECTRMQRIDLYKWYSESLINFCDKVCAIIRKHFPDIRGGMPIGVPRDSFGISKTEAVRLCAKYNVQARWTGWAFYEEFEKSEILAKRVSSPARFYGTDFGEEAALEIYEDNAGNAVYEAITNGTVLIHNDPENYMRAPELYKSLHTLLTGEQPVIDTGVLYPFENEYVGAFDDEEFMYDENGNRTFDVAFRAFVRDLAPVRRMTNYELADSKMIAGGFLDTVKRMIVPNGSYIPQETINALEDWAKKGGELLFLGKAKVMETDEEINTDGRQLVLEDSEQYVTEFPTRFVYFNRVSGEITEKKK